MVMTYETILGKYITNSSVGLVVSVGTVLLPKRQYHWQTQLQPQHMVVVYHLYAEVDQNGRPKMVGRSHIHFQNKLFSKFIF